MATSEKKTRGRQKVKMVRMEKESSRQVTFSKRRNGLFKKASELSTLCGAEAAIIVFSPGKKAFSFGHPSVETVIDRFLLSKSSPSADAYSNTEPLAEAQQGASVGDLNLELTLIIRQMEIEKKKGEEINKIKKAKGQHRRWWDQPIDELTMQHLVPLKASLEKLKKNVLQYGENLKMLEASNAPICFPSMGIPYPAIGFYNDAIVDSNGNIIGYRKNYY